MTVGLSHSGKGLKKVSQSGMGVCWEGFFKAANPFYSSFSFSGGMDNEG
jgi:hypothetical protein